MRWLLDCDKEKKLKGGMGSFYMSEAWIKVCRSCVCFLEGFHSPWGLICASKNKNLREKVTATANFAVSSLSHP